jgi:hypothetical protein
MANIPVGARSKVVVGGSFVIALMVLCQQGVDLSYLLIVHTPLDVQVSPLVSSLLLRLTGRPQLVETLTCLPQLNPRARETGG